MSNDWPIWATQKVEIHTWDASWQQRATDLIAALEPLLENWLEYPIERIGRTAVPGLAAHTGVIDLQATVGSLVDSEQADQMLAEAGWHLVPPGLDRRPWRRLHVLADGDRRVAHLHLVDVDHPRRRKTLHLRDQLRDEPALAVRYEYLKRTAAHEHGDDREAYPREGSLHACHRFRSDMTRVPVQKGRFQARSRLHANCRTSGLGHENITPAPHRQCGPWLPAGPRS